MHIAFSVSPDGLLAKPKPHFELKSKGKETRFWLDPFRKELWNYSLVVACHAAAGADHFQFEHVRFPTEWEISVAQHAKRNTEANRLRCLAGFLKQARQQLGPLNASFSVEGTPLFQLLAHTEARRYFQHSGGMTDCVVLCVLPEETVDSLRSGCGGVAKKLRVLVRLPDRNNVYCQAVLCWIRLVA